MFRTLQRYDLLSRSSLIHNATFKPFDGFAAKLLVCVLLLGPSLTYADHINVTATGQLVERPPGTVKWIETVTIENTSNVDVERYIVTSQPYYGDKWAQKNMRGQESEGFMGPRDGRTVRQERQINIPAKQKRIITFEFTGAEAIKWAGKYHDVYDAFPLNDDHKHGWTWGPYAFQEVTPGAGGSFAASFQYPYPFAVRELDVGPQTFSAEITGLSLPTGWSLMNFDFGPFTLDLNDSQLLTATFHTPPTIVPGEVAFVEFDIIRQGAAPRGHSVLGIQVIPEPSSAMLSAAGILGLLGYAWLQRRRTGR